MGGRLGRAVRRSVDGKGLKVWGEGDFSKKYNFDFSVVGGVFFYTAEKPEKCLKPQKNRSGIFAARA